MKYWIEANTQFQIPKIILGKFFRSGFLGGFGEIWFLEYLVGILLTYQLQRFDKTNSEVKTYALEKDENSFEALGKLS